MQDCAVQIARSPATACGAGIVHRDVKPATFMLSKSVEAKLEGLGLAAMVEPQPEDGSTPTVSHGRPFVRQGGGGGGTGARPLRSRASRSQGIRSRS